MKRNELTLTGVLSEHRYSTRKVAKLINKISKLNRRIEEEQYALRLQLQSLNKSIEDIDKLVLNMD